jgi:Cd2+/Zn2+-exporting ATPase
MDTLERVYKIRGLDCAEEVVALKKALSSMVGGEDFLSFDVLNGKISIADSVVGVVESDVIQAVSRTGMEAIPWREFVVRSEGDDSWWERNGRPVSCLVSGFLLAAAFLVHGSEHSWLDAVGQRGELHSYPILTKLLYGLAIVFAYWFVAPKVLLAVRGFRADMNVLMTVACLGAMGIGEWMEAGTVAFLFSLALVLETWSVGRARRSISALLDTAPDMARVYCEHDKEFEERSVESVATGALVQVRPGERIPLDGLVETGVSFVNQAPITGESIPVEKGGGDPVFAGSVNGDGLITFRSSSRAGESMLGRMLTLVEEAQSKRSDSEQWVERFARVYTPLMMALSLAVMVFVPLVQGGGWSSGVYQGLVLLVIACPCALVISTPVSIVSGLSNAARNGVLIKGGKYLEMPSKLRACAFDKTGTLTEGKVAVQEVVSMNGHTDEELLERAAFLEVNSDHPIALAIVKAAREQGISIESVDDYVVMPGRGAVGIYEGSEYWIGSHRFMHERAVESEECHEAALRLEETGDTVVAVGSGEHVCGLISVSDGVRGSAKEMVEEMGALGLARCVMLTGDNDRTAQVVGAAVGIEDVRSELLPQEKVDAVASMVGEHGLVAMVGDGINDAPAMAASSLGIAMGAAGSDAAIETADVALMSDDLLRIPWLIRHSRRTMRIIKQNIVFALGLKLVFVLLAFGGMATLWMAIMADMGASLLVIINGLRLLRG